jgi:hypothetical protein
MNNLPTVAVAHGEIFATEVVIKAGDLIPTDFFLLSKPPAQRDAVHVDRQDRRNHP